MLSRIKWSEDKKVKDEDDEDGDEEQVPNRCDLVWEVSQKYMQQSFFFFFFFFFLRVHHPFLRVAQTCKKESFLYMQTTQIAWTMI